MAGKVGRPRKYDDLRDARVTAEISRELREAAKARLATMRSVVAADDGTPTMTDLVQAAFLYAMTVPEDELRSFLSRYDTEAMRFHAHVVHGGESASDYFAERQTAHVQREREVAAEVRAELLAQFEARQAKAKTRRPKKAGGRA